MPKEKTFNYNIFPNETNDDYVCNVDINGISYPYEQIGHRVERGNDGVNTKYIYDKTTGEILMEISQNAISEQNSKTYLQKSTSDFAKSKNMPRKKISSNNKHIIELIKENSGYLQVSTGSSHDKRGIIAADIDLKRPYGKWTHAKTKKYVLKYLKPRFEMCSALGIQLPSSFQIHLTNGHVQLFWILDDEITIKETKYKTAETPNGERSIMYLENNNMWEPYMKVMRFMNIIFGGDLAFTGWQIKNMYLTDKIYEKDFTTFWNKDNLFEETEPSKIKTFPFNKLYKTVSEYTSDLNSDKFKVLSEMMEGFGFDNTQFKTLVFSESFMSPNDAKKYRINVKTITTNKSTHANIVMGRNQYVRMLTYEIIRIYQNNISHDRCKTIVKARLNAALKKYGKLGGTKNNGPYTSKDFDRDFEPTFKHARLTFNKNKCSKQGYTDEQRERAELQKRAKKNARLSTLIVILEENPSLIPDKLKNNKQIIELFKNYNIAINSPITISNYKKELGIKKDQKFLSPKNYKKADRNHDERIYHKQELDYIYENLNKEKISETSLSAWQKRIMNLDTSKIDDNFYKRKRCSLKWLKKVQVISHKSVKFNNSKNINILLNENIRETQDRFFVMRS